LAEIKESFTRFNIRAVLEGRAGLRSDEAGTSFGVTVDFDTIGENGPEK
jgi:hypothetical protein